MRRLVNATTECDDWMQLPNVMTECERDDLLMRRLINATTWLCDDRTRRPNANATIESDDLFMNRLVYATTGRGNRI